MSVKLNRTMYRKGSNGALFVAPGRQLYVLQPNGSLDRTVNLATETLVEGFADEGLTVSAGTGPFSANGDGQFDVWFPDGEYDLYAPVDTTNPITRWQPIAAGLAIHEADPLAHPAARKFFPVPTGGDDAPELISRLTAGEKDIALRRGTYNWAQQVVLSATTTLVGAGKHLTIVQKGFSGDLAPIGDGVELSHMTFDGQGDLYTGRGFVAMGGDGEQAFTQVRAFDFDSYCLDFTRDAGSQSKFVGCDLARYDGLTAGRYAVRIADVANPLSGRPRHFIGCSSEGAHFIELGSTNDTFIVGCNIGEILFSANTLAALITGSRLGGLYAASATELHVKGHNNAIVGCDVYPQVIIDAGFNHNVVGSNSYNNPPVVDNSGGEFNQADSPRKTYAPAITSSGTAPSVGDGTLSGVWARSGSTIHFAISLAAGSTTSLGTGELRFGVPMAPVSGPARTVVAHFLDASTNINYVLLGVIFPGNSYASLRADGLAGSLGQGNLPGGVALAAGDTFRIAGSYEL